ncbi:MAG: RNA polymerase sigma factor [Candidatus Aminicenantes bacterium]|nr:MAG: RNA polymerase sigma factor [Candidatus Aminicenantes bacterium]
MDVEEESLIAEAQKGHEAAFEKLYIRYREPIADLAFRYVGNYQDAEELLQDIFVKSFMAIKWYRPLPDARFFSWIYRIGINCAINFVKRKKRRPFRSGSEIREVDVQIQQSLQPEIQYVNREIREVFYKGLEAVSPKQKMIFILKNSDGMSTAEVAAHLKCSEGTVRKQFHRAIVKLRRELAIYRRREK